MGARASFDFIRTLNYTGISASYAAVGTPFTHEARGICITNNTQGDLLFTDDLTGDKLFVAAKANKLWDIQSNMNTKKDDKFVLPIATQIYVKQLTAPVSGDVWLEILYCNA